MSTAQDPNPRPLVFLFPILLNHAYQCGEINEGEKTLLMELLTWGLLDQSDLGRLLHVSPDR